MKNGYRINYEKRTITVTKKFLTIAETDLGSNEHRDWEALRSTGMRIVYPSESTRRERRFSFAEMVCYIRKVENSESYMKDFEAVREAYAGQYMKVWGWFKKAFPNYNRPVVLNEFHQIVVHPSNNNQQDHFISIA